MTTHKDGVRLVCKKLKELGFVVTTSGNPKKYDFTVAEKTVSVRAVSVNRKKGGDCWSINEDESKARKVANEVHFRVFVKLDGDKIARSFVWGCDRDQDLIGKRGKKWGLYPYRQKTLSKWQKREGEAGWKWMKTELARTAAHRVSAQNRREPGPLWTREETMMAFNLYSKMPYGQIRSSHPAVVELAKIIHRPPASVSMKMCSLVEGDPQHPGLRGTSIAKAVRQVWEEFNSDPGGFMLESESLFRKRAGKTDDGLISDLTSETVSEPVLAHEILNLPQGETRRRLVNARTNQSLFRQMVLSAYESRCCMTGIAVPELLVASHIVPWSKNPEQRINPRNGLCLNALHDRAFDRGLISVSGDLTVRVSPKLKKAASESGNENMNFVVRTEGRAIAAPHRFAPEREFLEYHRRNIFQR